VLEFTSNSKETITAKMLETVLATSTFSIKTEVGSASDPLSWERQQFPDSNSAKFSPIKQEVMDTSFDLDQTDFTELKPLPFDYGSTGLTGSLDPILNNNNNNTSNNNNNNNNKLADLYINIKPLSPHHFPFHPSPSDVTSSGSMSPQGMTKIDFSTDQNAFDDLANIVGLSVGADSTVPSLEGDVDLEALFENIKPLPLLLPGDSGSTAATGSSSVFDVQSSTAESSSSSSLLSNSISNQSLSNTQPYIGSLASLVKGSRMTIVEPRDSFPQNLSPILRGAITGGGGGGAGYHLSYPQLKFESMEMIKQEYYTQEQLPHSTVGSLADQHHHHQQQRRLGPDGCLIRSKPKPHKMKQVGKNIKL
jgi:hypothetical protein